ncbi:hypothetical protein B1R32_104208 [Abditibacterium utsteinense]|uniref:ATP synthase I chain n=1 Tax=Abditibacterium utsteinense TaxID=1960156 RepID=A0A2S8SVB0_9BACT|nr:hypothetical protein [Abditibacterium utsteinense]PQV64709.1 hypothetical protein B1R32_104208 [Abditibacterium utsteinense]
MSKILVPDAPQLPISARGDKKSGNVSVVAPKSQSPLDAAFLSRIYRSMLWFGAILVILMALGFKTAPTVVSFASGVLLAALLLRAQEIGVRALMRPSEQLGGFDARLILVVLLPLKFVVMAGALYALDHFGLILPAFLAIGFFAGQCVIVAKVIGWAMTRKSK